MKPSAKDPSKIRLQVYLSRNGVCSRRRALEIVQAGWVRVNGQTILEPSFAVGGQDVISVDNRTIEKKDYTYIILNKPAGVVTTKVDRFAEKTVLDLLPKHLQHVVPVGRLDKDTEGPLLLTNDGDTAYRLTHPKFNIDKTYFVRTIGELKSQDKKILEEGVTIDGQKTSPAKISQLKVGKNETEFLMTIHEGRKRQIRRMVSLVGHRVMYLKRISQGPLNLSDLPVGRFRELNPKELDSLKNLK